MLGLLGVVGRVLGASAGDDYWVEPMMMVHARFTGEKGTFAQFGDSITDTMAFWAPLGLGAPKNMDKETEEDYRLVKDYMQARCWREWKGPQWGNLSGMTINWAHKNVDAWLKKMNPEVVAIMFGTNDMRDLSLKQYRQKLREVIEKCLANGTVVILSTIPPCHGRQEKALQFAEAIRDVGRELKVPVCDFMAEVLKRRPEDWDGTLEKFADRKGYQVLTLISGDGVHPSNPKEFVNDFSEEALRTSGYSLRNYLVLRSYAAVIRKVLQ